MEHRQQNDERENECLPANVLYLSTACGRLSIFHQWLPRISYFTWCDPPNTGHRRLESSVNSLLTSYDCIWICLSSYFVIIFVCAHYCCCLKYDLHSTFCCNSNGNFSSQSSKVCIAPTFVDLLKKNSTIWMSGLNE